MEKDQIISILEDWNFWRRELETGIERSYYLDRLESFLKNNQVIAIVGARRSGKSFIMRQLARRLINKGISSQNILMINFEDPRFPELDSKALQEIYESYIEILNPNKKPFIFLDEVQEMKEWEKWVSTAHELKKAKLIVSGSNATLLSKELATLLTGRHLDLIVFPLDFKEFLAFKRIAVESKLDLIAKRIEIKRALREYLEFGSFPEVVLSKEKKELLLKYFEDIVEKDLVRRFKIRKAEKLKALGRFYLTNIASLITFSSVEKFLGLSADTAERFSTYFETAYMLFFLKRFSFKVKEQEKSPRKVYAIDTGLANVVGFRFSEDVGRLAENAVFLKLKKEGLEFYYWKDQQHREVDFVVKEGKRVTQLLQVCWKLSHEVKKREVNALIKASKELRCNNLFILTEDYEAQERLKGKKIAFIPLWKWLLLDVQSTFK